MDVLLTQREIGCLCVLDISAAALARAQERLGDLAQQVQWIEADVTAEWATPPIDIWHDRAVFHFLTDASDRARYVARMRDILKPDGAAIIATFAPDGPERCSGLPVMRYSSEKLAAKLGDGFRLVESVPHLHHTPSGATQSFQYSRFARRAS